MAWLLKLLVILVSFYTVVIVTIWYVKATWPEWWEQHIVALDPEDKYKSAYFKE